MAFTLHESSEMYSASTPTVDLSIFTSYNTTLSVLYLVYSGSGLRVGGDPLFASNPMTLVDVSSYGTVKIEMWYILNDNIPKSVGTWYTIPNNTGLYIRAVGMTYDTPANVMTKYNGKVIESGNGSSIDLSIFHTPPSVSISGAFASGISSDMIPNRTQLAQDNLPLLGRYAVQYYLANGSSLPTVNFKWDMLTAANWIGIAATFTELVPPPYYWVQANGINYNQIGQINTCIRSSVDDFNTIPNPPFY